LHLNLSQLRALLAVATQGSFTKAAEALHTTQPALSAKIQQIEDVLGARLFDRTTRSVALTNFARDLLPAVERIIGETEALLGRARDASAGITGRVVLAALPSMSSTLLPECIARFRAQRPGISIVLKDAIANGIADMVMSEEADFGIGTATFVNRQLEFTPMMTDHMAAVFPRGHVLASLGRPGIEDVVRHPLILMDRKSSVRRIVDEALFARNRMSQATFEVAFMSTAIGLVRAGLGVTILPESALEVRSASDLESRRLNDPLLTREIGVLKRRACSLSPASESFIDFLLANVGDSRPTLHEGRAAAKPPHRARPRRRRRA
jgi:DNA-binding transcriptional LysR family regulator